MLLHILDRLPPGPKALVVHHRKEEVLRSARARDITPCEQPVMNGTGGALLAARPFLKGVSADRVIITMGDVPLVRRRTYASLLERLEDRSFVVLGFIPEDPKRYGLLETSEDSVRRIVEWAHWHRLPPANREHLRVCNAGIYAARRDVLLSYLDRLEERPHLVHKEREGGVQEIQEFFITDLVALMAGDGHRTGYVLADESEVMGVDDPTSLEAAQALFRTGRFAASAPRSS